MSQNQAWLPDEVGTALTRLKARGHDKQYILRIVMTTNEVLIDLPDESVIHKWYNEDQTRFDDLICALANGHSSIPQDTSTHDQEWHKQEALYDEHISPLVQAIADHCQDYQIPALLQFCIATSDPRAEDKPFFCTTTLTHFDHTPNFMKELGHRMMGNADFITVAIATSEERK